MKTTIIAIASVVVSFLIGYASGYKKGHSVASAKDQADRFAEYGNDTNSDRSLKHSPSYDFAYNHGKADGTIEARLQDITDCGNHLADVVIRLGDVKDAAKLLASGYVTIKQLRAAQQGQLFK